MFAPAKSLKPILMFASKVKSGANKLECLSVASLSAYSNVCENCQELGVKCSTLG